MTWILIVAGLSCALFLARAVFIFWKVDDQIERDTMLRAEDYNPDI